MGRYFIFLSEESKSDIDNLNDVIMCDYQAPATAFKYIQGLLDSIFSLSTNPESFSVHTSPFFCVMVPMLGVLITKKWQLSTLCIVTSSISTVLYQQI
jgi:hypothetical protein